MTNHAALIAMARDWMDPVVVRDAPERVPFVIEQLIAALLASASPAPEGWRDIASAPKDGTPVLLSRDGWCCEGYYLNNTHTAIPWQGWKRSKGGIPIVPQPVYWVPLPPAPEKETR